MRRHRRRATGHGLDILAPATPREPAAPARRPAPATPADDLSLLSAPVAPGDLITALATKAARVKLPSATLALGVAALVGAGFLGGVLLEKHQATSSSTSNPLASLAGGGLPNLGGSGTTSGAAGGTGGFTFGSATIGTVKLVDGSTIYVQGFTGSITKVTTTPATKVQVSVTGSLKDLQPGATVTIQGAKRGTGTVAATSISETSPRAG